MARHWCTAVANALFGPAFPWGTLFINVLGSFIIGFFFVISAVDGRFPASANVRIFVMTGLCGGYTTFSAFSIQSLGLLREGQWLRAIGYVGGSVFLCLIAVSIGYGLAAAMSGLSESR